MKPNIDLTRNRDFRNRRGLSSLSAILKSVLYEKRYPWTFEKLCSLEKERELVMTGGKEIRERKKRHKALERGKVCDRCGYDFTRKPWSGRGLCKRCGDDIDEEFRYERDVFLKKFV